MNWWQIALTVYGSVAVAYTLRLAQLYFRFFEGDTRNGTIIVEAIVGGVKWPWSVVWSGVKETVMALLPPKVEQPVVVAQPPGNPGPEGTLPMPAFVMPAPAAGGRVGGVVIGDGDQQ